MDPLTRRQMDILHYISDVRAKRGASPMLREIASAFGVSVPRAHQYLELLKRKGYVTAGRFARRGIRLARSRGEWKARQAWQGDFDRRIGSRLARATDLDEVIDLARRDLRAWLDIGAVDVLLYDAGRRRLLDSGFFRAPAPGAEVTKAPSVEPGSPADRAFRRRKPVTGAEGAAIPIPGRERPLGVLRLTARPHSPGFDEGALARAAAAAAAFAPALERCALHADLRRGIRLQSALIGLCRTVNSVRDFREILREVHGIVAGLVPATLFLIEVLDDRGRWWVLMETDEVDGKRFENTTPRPAQMTSPEIFGALKTQPWWIRHRTPAEVAALEARGPQSEEAGTRLTGIGFAKRSRSLLYVPLRSGGGLIGWLSVQCYDYNAYTARDAEDLALIGEYIGLAAQNALREELERGTRERDAKRLALLDRLEADLAGGRAEGAEVLRTRIDRFRRDLAKTGVGGADPARKLAE